MVSTKAGQDHLPTVTILRLVWLQQFYAPETDRNGIVSTRWRRESDLPPAALRLHSPYDLDARYAVKGDTPGGGYTAHSTETCDEHRPHLIAHGLTTPARTHDSHVVEPLHTALPAQNLLPTEHIFDAGYVDTQLIVTRTQTFGVDRVGPVAADYRWHALAAQGVDRARCTSDWDAHVVTCPQGRTRATWQTTRTPHGAPVIHAQCAKPTCRSCPVQAPCVTSPGTARERSVRPPAECDVLPHARQRQHTPEWKQPYAARAGIEGTIAQVRRCDVRHERSIGLARTRVQHILVAVALNLVRWYAWWVDHERPHPPRKPSKCAALSAAGV